MFESRCIEWRDPLLAQRALIRVSGGLFVKGRLCGEDPLLAQGALIGACLTRYHLGAIGLRPQC